MRRYVLMRLLHIIPVLLGATFVVFALLSLSPGDPAQLILGLGARPEELEMMREQLCLNDPLPVQYVNHVAGALQGNFGTSYTTRQPVWDMSMLRLDRKSTRL